MHPVGGLPGVFERQKGVMCLLGVGLPTVVEPAKHPVKEVRPVKRPPAVRVKEKPFRQVQDLFEKAEACFNNPPCCLRGVKVFHVPSLPVNVGRQAQGLQLPWLHP